MQSVGTKLREAREKKGFSLEEINARTRINSRNLIAIERDDVGRISSPFFYRSFVKQYAEEVGIDFRVIASSVDSLAGIMRQPDLPGQGKHQPVRVSPIKARIKRDFSWVMPTAVFLGMVAISSVGYAALRFYKPWSQFLQNSAVSSIFHNASALKPPFPKVRAPQMAVERAPVVPAPVKQAPKDNQVLNSDTKPAADEIHLELAALERTWLSVSADGKPAYSGILEPPQVKVLEGRRSAWLKTGNAGGVSIIFNGKSIGAIGPRGKTRTVVFTKAGFEVEPEDGVKLIPASHIGG
jgi:cytoskeleton protein RodZ